ncbi:MAG TPA: hypothetical protein VLT62_05115 [Candidatus Methylomirabilis sp.]|nr:hypothetical protein [Candidatus Methylomirabilis sp.]
MTVNVPVLPSVRGKTGGSRLTTRGRGITTLTWLGAEVPFNDAVTVAVPGLSPKTAMA